LHRVLVQDLDLDARVGLLEGRLVGLRQFLRERGHDGDGAGLRWQCLWQQLGVANAEADAIARAAGLDSVMDRCVKIEYARLFGGLNWVGVNTKVISARRPRP
jgi:hypothetical protein